MKIYFASGNAHKRDELARILDQCTIVIPSEEGIVFNPEETENSFFGNALVKARALWEIVGEPVLADDSGLCVDALDGVPGVYSARYGEKNGLSLTSSQKNDLLLSRMNGIKNRSCRFVCNMVLYLGKDRFFSVQETFEGELADTQTGTGGFGYDPIVLIPEYGKTVAELSAIEKDAISHRGKSARIIARHLFALASSER